jgi:hypothetical protein
MLKRGNWAFPYVYEVRRGTKREGGQNAVRKVVVQAIFGELPVVLYVHNEEDVDKPSQYLLSLCVMVARPPVRCFLLFVSSERTLT